MEHYIQKAVEIQQTEGNTSQRALEKYKEAIAAYNKDGENEYEFLYAHYQVMWIYSNQYQIEKALPYAEKCLELLDDKIRTGAIMHFTDTGLFYEEVIRYATNVVAWYMYERAEDNAELEKALETISLGCNYTDKPVDFYLFDTKVRLLLKLGRKDEAFRIVYTCLKQAPYFRDFEDLKRDQEYKAWKEAFESGKVEYSDEEKDFLQKASRIITQLREQSSNQSSEQLRELIPAKEMLLIKEIKKTYSIPDGWYEDNDYILLFKGDVHIKGNLDEGWYEQQIKGMIWKNNLYGIVVDGNLVVDGDVLFKEPILHIEKDITCNYLQSKDEHIRVNGNANVKYGVYGYYNDGSLDIRGKFFTPYIIAYDHSMPHQADQEFIYIEGSNGDDMEDIEIGKSQGSGYGWDWQYFEDSAKLLSQSVWCDSEEDGNKGSVFSVNKFFDLVRDGKNPFVDVE